MPCNCGKKKRDKSAEKNRQESLIASGWREWFND